MATNNQLDSNKKNHGNTKELKRKNKPIVRSETHKIESIVDENSIIKINSREAPQIEATSLAEKPLSLLDSKSTSIPLQQTAQPAEKIINEDAFTEEKYTKVQEQLDKRFTILDKSYGAHYYYKDTNKKAFLDKGSKIVAKENSKLVATSVVALAEAKGWTNIKVTGNNKFKREVWIEANIKGIDVKGYSPSEQDKRDLDNSLNSISAVDRNKKSEKSNKFIAPTAGTGIGETKSTNPIVAKKQAALVNSDNHLEKSLKKIYISQPKQEVLKNHPELEPVYKIELAAKQFANSRINNKPSREKFVSGVRNNAIGAIANGQKLPELKQNVIQPSKEASANVSR